MPAEALPIHDQSQPELMQPQPQHHPYKNEITYLTAVAVTGHGIPEQLLAEVFRQFQAAFALPAGEHTAAVQNSMRYHRLARSRQQAAAAKHRVPPVTAELPRCLALLC
jgi:hypothetical protein